MRKIGTFTDHRGWLTLMAAASVVNMAPSAFSQNAERNLPRIPADNRESSTLPAPPLPIPNHDTSVVIESLTGIHLIRDISRLKDNTGPGIVIDSVTLADRQKLIDELAQRLGRAVTVADLDAITSRIIREYRDAGRPVADAVVPEQDVTDGILRVLVIEAELGAVRVEGNANAKLSERVTDQIHIKPGDPISAPILQEDLAYLNKMSPYRAVDLTFAKGTGINQTDIVLRTQGSLHPLRLYAGYDNTGSNSTGEDRIIAGLNWGDAFGLGLDHQFNYQLTSGDDINRFQAHGLSYVIPLANRHTLSMFGTWSRAVPTLPDARLDSAGENWQIGTRYNIPIGPQAAVAGRFRHSVDFGFDFKRSNNNLDFGGESVYSKSVDTAQLVAAYHGVASDATGSTQAGVELTLSPGNITSGNDDDAFDQARTGADATYAILSASLDREWTLPYDLTLTAKARAQISTGALIGGEQFNIGGSNSVRGYAEGTLNSDNGVGITVELESPKVELLPLFHIEKLQDDLRFFVFADASAGWNYNSSDSNPASVRAISVGPGVRYRVGSNFALDLTYGFRVDDVGVDDGESGRSHVSVNGSFSW